MCGQQDMGSGRPATLRGGIAGRYGFQGRKMDLYRWLEPCWPQQRMHSWRLLVYHVSEVNEFFNKNGNLSQVFN